MVLGKLLVPGRSTIWITVVQGLTALTVGAGGDCLDIFTLIYPFSPLSPSLWETARYRLKYCLKGQLNTNQPTNQLFPDTPTKTDQIYHDVDIEGSNPIKEHPYRMNPTKLQYLRREIQYLLDNDVIEPSQSDWSYPCILVPKPDGTFRMCTDYRKMNSVTKTDSFPVPRMDDYIENIGQANYVTNSIF